MTQPKNLHELAGASKPTDRLVEAQLLLPNDQHYILRFNETKQAFLPWLYVDRSELREPRRATECTHTALEQGMLAVLGSDEEGFTISGAAACAECLVLHVPGGTISQDDVVPGLPEWWREDHTLKLRPTTMCGSRRTKKLTEMCNQQFREQGGPPQMEIVISYRPKPANLVRVVLKLTAGPLVRLLEVDETWNMDRLRSAIQAWAETEWR